MSTSSSHAHPPEAKIITRIDPPHPLPSATAAAEAEVPHQSVTAPEKQAILAAAGQSPELAEERLRMHASQLASYLRQRQRELDRREALLHSQLALQENELRSHRLWMREREVHVTDTEAELRRQVLELEQRIAAFSAAEITDQIDRRDGQDIAKRETEVVVREAQLDDRERQIVAQANALQVAEQRLADEQRRFADQVRIERQKVQFIHESHWHAHRRLLASIERHREALDERERRLMHSHQLQRIDGKQLDRQSKANKLEAELHDWEKRLSRRERQVDQQTAELERERQSLDRERNSAREELERDRQALQEERQNLLIEVAQRQTQLHGFEDALDKRQALVDQLHRENAERHRENLEMRLIIEQAWSDLSESTPSAALTQTVVSLRRQLADEHRESIRMLEEKKFDIAKLADGLEQRRTELQERQDELQQWLATQRREMESQALQLCEREAEMDRLESQHQSASREWVSERRQLQRQVRELEGRLAGRAAA